MWYTSWLSVVPLRGAKGDRHHSKQKHRDRFRGGKLYLTAQDAALTVKIESYLETEPLDSRALSAGETCTIRIRDDGMEFVR